MRYWQISKTGTNGAVEELGRTLFNNLLKAGVKCYTKVNGSYQNVYRKIDSTGLFVTVENGNYKLNSAYEGKKSTLPVFRYVDSNNKYAYLVVENSTPIDETFYNIVNSTSTYFAPYSNTEVYYQGIPTTYYTASTPVVSNITNDLFFDKEDGKEIYTPVLNPIEGKEYYRLYVPSDKLSSENATIVYGKLLYPEYDNLRSGLVTEDGKPIAYDVLTNYYFTTIEDANGKITSLSIGEANA